MVRIYAYDADGNRTSLTARSPGTEGKCATEGGAIEKHSYDTADRLMDSGIAYDPFGDITTLGASDAGGSELKSSYYADGQLASQEQASQTIGYNIDPARRVREIVSTGKATSDVTNHYDGPGGTPSWTSYQSGEATRNISGIGAGLAAIQYNGEKPIIQLANLHGDIIGTAKDSETEIHPESTTDTTEYGVPTATKPTKYSWLGADELPTELPSGVIDMGARSYVPEIGRFLQPDPSPGGSANAYAYTHGDPLNESDLSGEWSLGESSGGTSAVGTGEGVQLTGGVGIAEGAIMPAPVNTQIEAAFQASPPWDQVTAGDEEYGEYEEEWEEEGEEEYAAWHLSSKQGGEESQQLEGGLFYRALDEAAVASRGSASSSMINNAIRLCESQTNEGHVACSRFVNYVLKMSRRTMRRVGSWILAGGTIDGELPIPNPVAALLAKVSGAYLQGLGAAMLGAAQMKGKGGCFLSFHTIKVPLLGDTGVPDGEYVAQCH